MDVRYSYKIEDFVEIVEVADKLDPRRRRIRFGLKFVGGFLLVAPFLTSRGPLHPDMFLLGMSAFGVCLIVCGILQDPRRVARRYYANEVEGTEYEATIRQDGIIAKSPTGGTELRWAAFARVIEGKDVVALVERTVMYAFPRRAFSQEQWTDFIALLKKHVPVWNGSTRSIRLL